MTVPLLPEASAAIHAAVYAARSGGLSKEPASSKTKERKEGRNGNFVCSPLSILLVFAVAMRGARGRTFEEMERLLPVQGVPALLRLTTYGSSGSLRAKEQQAGEPEVESEEGMRDLGTELDLVSRMYVDGRLASNSYFKSFRDELWQECTSGEAQMQQLPVQLIDCNKAGESAQEINAFVSEATRGHITKLVSADQITPATRLLLLSAAFFKGPWWKPFPKHGTTKCPFYALHFEDDQAAPQATGSKESQEERVKDSSDQLGAFAKEPEPRLTEQNVDMMHVLLESQSEFYFRVDDTVTAVGLPYRDSNYVMYVVQPNNPRHLGKLMRFKGEKSSTESFPTLDDVVRSMRESREEAEEVEAYVSLPRFALKGVDNHLDLIPLFVRLLKIKAPFDRELADFSGISGDQSLLMSAFIHQAEIEVDEEGTVASAATVAAIALKMAFRHKKRVEILINKPFAFQIRYHPPDETAAQEWESATQGTPVRETPVLGDYVLFTGCITDVLAAQQ